MQGGKLEERRDRSAGLTKEGLRMAAVENGLEMIVSHKIHGP
jgi:hypothetical protein